MRGRTHPQRSMLAIVDPGNGYPGTIRCDGLRPWPMRPWNGCRRHSTACKPRWAGPRCHRSDCRGLAADFPVLGAQRAWLLRGAGYNLPCRWFLDMDLVERSFDATVFTKNGPRLLARDAGRALFDEVVWAADAEGLLSDEHSAWTGP